MAEAASTRSRPRRSQRQRSQGRSVNYTADTSSESEEEVGYDILDIVKRSPKSFQQNHVEVMKGQDVTLAFALETGLRQPIVATKIDGLGIQIPPAEFTVNDVERLVGSSRVVDVVDVRSQAGLTMALRDWVKYYNDPDKDVLLNVISLEVSKTKLAALVQSPTMVRDLDWVSSVWPREHRRHRASFIPSSHKISNPKVEKYCLMSVAGCYTDFHIDFGGSSVWYHVLKGHKIFWLIPPTQDNLSLFETWTKSNQSSTFFADMCPDQCSVVHLKPGNTFFLPTGWIHAVYTPADSLVFGGNFLHGLNMQMQLRVYKLENTLRVPSTYRFPLYQELMWYAGAKYVARFCSDVNVDSPLKSLLAKTPFFNKHRALTEYEREGLIVLVQQLTRWQQSVMAAKRIPPDLGIDPTRVISSLCKLAAEIAVNPESMVSSPTSSSSPSSSSSVKRKGKSVLPSSVKAQPTPKREKRDGTLGSQTSQAVQKRKERKSTEMAEAQQYSRLSMVRTGVIRQIKLQHGRVPSDAEVTARAMYAWTALAASARTAMRRIIKAQVGMDDDDDDEEEEEEEDDEVEVHECKGSARVRRVGFRKQRASKYAGKKWRATKHHMSRVRQFNTSLVTQTRGASDVEDVGDAATHSTKLPVSKESSTQPLQAKGQKHMQTLQPEADTVASIPKATTNPPEVSAQPVTTRISQEQKRLDFASELEKVDGIPLKPPGSTTTNVTRTNVTSTQKTDPVTSPRGSTTSITHAKSLVKVEGSATHAPVFQPREVSHTTVPHSAVSAPRKVGATSAAQGTAGTASTASILAATTSKTTAKATTTGECNTGVIPVRDTLSKPRHSPATLVADTAHHGNLKSARSIDHNGAADMKAKRLPDVAVADAYSESGQVEQVNSTPPESSSLKSKAKEHQPCVTQLNPSKSLEHKSATSQSAPTPTNAQELSHKPTQAKSTARSNTVVSTDYIPPWLL
eukprot:m.316060 g.316060  ORF g.316060 m.316060 type:complete len:966 (+) comp15978_c0_seq4:182-3079(+)